MIDFRSFFISILLIFSNYLGYAQENESAIDFQSPINIPLVLSSNFGELRPHHFHSGLDIKTNQREGYEIYSSEEGFVSRIKLSVYGYGNAIYIEHPNGYTTVYAHLKNFSPKIDSIVQKIQFANEMFYFDTTFLSKNIVVDKGEIIGYSGNTGASSAPHLHYEIRNTDTEHPVNPLLFSFNIKDNIPPKIFNLYIYPLNDSSHVNFENKRLKIPIINSKGIYKLKISKTPVVHGKIGFALDAIDYMDGTRNKYGIYSLSMQVDEEELYFFQMDEFSFGETRYLHTFTDYQIAQKRRKRIYKSFAIPSQNLSFVSHKNRGVVNFKDSVIHTISFKLSDIKSNTSKLKFKVKSDKNSYYNKNFKYGEYMAYNQGNIYQNENVFIDIPDGALYEDLYFQFDEKKDSTFLSNIINVHNKFTPLHKPIRLFIKPNNNFQFPKDKALIVKINEKGQLTPLKTDWKKNSFYTKSREFGNFAVTVDTIPPTIKPLFNIEDFSTDNTISIQIKDNLSGIKRYRGTIDGKWVPFAYDLRKKRILYTLDEKYISRNDMHKLKLEVIDNKENISDYEIEFKW